jgi:hypothetical protein
MVIKGMVVSNIFLLCVLCLYFSSLPALFILVVCFFLFVAYGIKKGDRYIIAGFCNYGPDTHANFMKLYNPQYEGHAAEAGFRSGDLITGITYCRFKKEKKTPEQLAQEQKEREEKENRKREALARGEELEEQCEVTKDPPVIKRLKKITLKTTDEEWKRYAESCELLAPRDNVTFKVKRYVDDGDIEGGDIVPDTVPVIDANGEQVSSDKSKTEL